MRKGRRFGLWFFFVVFVLGFSFGCGTKKTTEVRYIVPPKWVLGYNTNELFSAIGVISIDKKIPLTEIISRAENNAIENLHSDVLVKFENCFISLSASLLVSDREEVVKKMNIMAGNAFGNNILKNISRRDELWISPDSNVAYVMVSGDSGKIIKAFVNELDRNAGDYKNNQEMATFISRLKRYILDDSCFNKKNNEEGGMVLSADANADNKGQNSCQNSQITMFNVF